MQAEVDKYVSTRWLLQHQASDVLPSTVLDILFDRTHFCPDLNAEEEERYRSASELARTYCHSLELRYPVRGIAASMYSELREFFRLGKPDKISHIHSSRFA